MKIFGNNFDIEVGRMIYTNNPFKLLRELVSANKELIVITPFTKVKEIINFTKNGGLESSFAINDINIEGMLNIGKLNQTSEEFNRLLRTELLSLNLDMQKFVKTIFELSDVNFSEENINSILEFAASNFLKLPPIAIAGFEDLVITKKIPHIELISDFRNKVKFENLDGLLIEQADDVFEVHDVDAFVSWLELKTKTALSVEMINNFLNGKVDISSYLINNALKELK